MDKIRGSRTVVLFGLLFTTTVFAWVSVIRSASAMQMPHTIMTLSGPSVFAFTLQWGVMMTAMMLPSASPMILLYGIMSRRESASPGRVIPPELFALVYVALWLLTGVPVYIGSVAIGHLAAGSPTFAMAIPYAIACSLLAAGVYQLTPAKRACLSQCEAPLNFLMRKWRGGYTGSLRLAAAHAAYCIGCCWALMLILVVAGAMSLPWVLAIALVVFAEKILPQGQRSARIIGVMLIVAGIVIAVRSRAG